MRASKVMTLCFILDGDKVLLGQKKRGFGEGKWNGFGGKLKQKETVEQAMKREVKEECSIVVSNYRKTGIVWETHPMWSETLEVHIFMTNQFRGIPKESEEMKPQWFRISEIPYHSMWEGDKIWIPRIIAGESITMLIHLGIDGKVTASKNI